VAFNTLKSVIFSSLQSDRAAGIVISSCSLHLPSTIQLSRPIFLFFSSQSIRPSEGVAWGLAGGWLGVGWGFRGI